MRYVTIVYSRTGSYEETARRLGLDRRTVKAKVDAALLGRLRACRRIKLTHDLDDHGIRWRVFALAAVAINLVAF